MNDTWIQGVRFNHIPDGQAVADKIGYIYFHPVHDRVIARVDRSKNLRGAVIYTQSSGRGGSCVCHIAAFDRCWLNQDMLWVMFDYPFNQIGVKKIIIQVPESNTRSFNFVKNLGFVVEHVIEHGYPGESMILMSMTRAQCRFLKMPPPKLSEPLDG